MKAEDDGDGSKQRRVGIARDVDGYATELAVRKGAVASRIEGLKMEASR